MGWFDRFKKDKEPEVNYLALPLSTLIRNALYDSMLENPEAISKAIGLPPISEEVSEKEEEASEERLQKIEVILPLIEAYSEISSKIAFAGYSHFIPPEQMSEEAIEMLSNFFQILSFSSITSCISALVDLKVVSVSITELDIYGK